ncbi:MAG: hypothetical protein IPP69_11990 [Flavobacteriales bacterium]|nr:hypothetical protein [Flavobacteriales bacterium]
MEKDHQDGTAAAVTSNGEHYSIFAAPDQTKAKMAVTSSRRLVGIDVAYGLAVMGCIVYAFWFIMGDKVTSVLTQTRFSILMDIFPALFFFLNGFTVTLTMRDRRVSNRKLLSYLGKRGSVLFLIGLSCCVIWPMNIFHRIWIDVHRCSICSAMEQCGIAPHYPDVHHTRHRFAI